MQVQSSRQVGLNQARVSSLTTAQPSEKTDSQQPAPSDSFKLSAEQIVTKGAYAAGGALGGVGLGVVTGNLLNSLTGTTLSTSIGGALGGVGGAVTALAISDSDDTGENVARVFGGWAGSSAGAFAGQKLIGMAGEALAAAGASPWIGSAGHLVGTAVGGLAGASLPLIGSRAKVAGLVHGAALAGVGGVAGVGLGGLAQTWLQTVAPSMGPVAAAAPILGATVLGSIPIAIMQNEPDSIMSNVSLGGLGAGVGFTLGAIGGAFAGAAGASQAAVISLPVLGAVAGAGKAFSLDAYERGKASESDSCTAAVAGTAALGSMIGEFGGKALSALTGNAIYDQLGMAAGTVNGALLGFTRSGVDTHKVTHSLLGGTGGAVTGALLGTALTALTGQETWKTVMPLLGGAAGTLSGAAVAFKS